MFGLSDVKQLLTQTDERTLTMYVDVDNATPENQAAMPAWHIWVKNTLDQLSTTLNGDQRESWDYIRDWVRDFIVSYEPTDKGLVIIAGPSYQHTYNVPMKLENQAYFGTPTVGPLLWMIDEYEPYLVVMVDQEKARFFVSYLGSVGFQEGMNIDIDDYDFAERTTMHGPGPGIDNAAVHGGTGKDDFKDMIDEFRARFYRDVVDNIARLREKHKVRRVIIGGSEQSAHAVHNFMDDHQKASVVAVMSIPMRSNMQQIQEHVVSAALEHERDQELELVSQVIDFAKSGGRGALGRQAVRDALDMQRVETLILPYPMGDEDNDLAFRALQLNSNVELVHGEAASRLHEEGDIAARLYYAL